jgi:bifunctional DNA-binding transcriptional regulator/antitoxin component of YhaV-PrlF toxin-antitoxin module
MTIKTALISKNRQIAIPASFGIEPGQRVKILLDSDTGIITIEKIPNAIDMLFGIAKGLNFSSDQFLKEKKAEEKKRDKKLGLNKLKI